MDTISATIRDNGTGEVLIDDRVEAIDEHTVEKARAKAILLLIKHAAEQDRVIAVVSHDPSGTAHLLVSPDGHVQENIRATATAEPGLEPEAATPASGVARVPVTSGPVEIPDASATPIAAATMDAAAPVPDAPATTEPVPAGAPTAAAEPTPPITKPALRTPAPATAPIPTPATAPAPAPAPAAKASERPGPPRRSFIAEEERPPRAEQGFRGFLASLGLPVAPSASEASERSDVAAVSQHWHAPRTIAIVNGKGGASKTPTTAMLAAVFARTGGSGVLAWDNNETRGTLGWRTEQGRHEATVQALLPNADALMRAEAQASDLASFLHHQPTDKYDVLRSNPNVLAEDQRLTIEEFDAIHAVAAKYHRLLFIDSGNDESAPRWRRMIERADQIVIATTARGEHAEAGALLLEALRDSGAHQAELARNAIVVVSQADHKGGTKQAEHVADGFRQMARESVVVPFDPAMRAGKLAFDSLRPETKRAWLAAAAAVAKGL